MSEDRTMDACNRFESRGTYLMMRLENLAALAACVVLAVMHIGEIRWLHARGNRHTVVVATKVHYPVGPDPNDRGNSRRHILAACEASLRRLQTDYIDLYQLHRPSPEIPVEETLYALDMLVRDGKVRYIGATTHPAWQVMEALMVSA